MIPNFALNTTVSHGFEQSCSVMATQKLEEKAQQHDEDVEWRKTGYRSLSRVHGKATSVCTDLLQLCPPHLAICFLASNPPPNIWGRNLKFLAESFTKFHHPLRNFGLRQQVRKPSPGKPPFKPIEADTEIPAHRRQGRLKVAISAHHSAASAGAGNWVAEIVTSLWVRRFSCMYAYVGAACKLRGWHCRCAGHRLYWSRRMRGGRCREFAG